jgi:hypothetical protein
MDDTKLLNGAKEIPILLKSEDQKLIVTFKRDDAGMGHVTLAFDPDMDNAVTPEQIAAANVATHILNLLQNTEGATQDE